MILMDDGTVSAEFTPTKDTVPMITVILKNTPEELLRAAEMLANAANGN